MTLHPFIHFYQNTANFVLRQAVMPSSASEIPENAMIFSFDA